MVASTKSKWQDFSKNASTGKQLPTTETQRRQPSPLHGLYWLYAIPNNSLNCECFVSADRRIHEQIVSCRTNTIGIKSVSIVFGMIAILKRVHDLMEKLGIIASVYLLCGKVVLVRTCITCTTHPMINFTITCHSIERPTIIVALFTHALV